MAYNEPTAGCGVGNPASGNLLMPWNLISTATGSPTSGYMTLMPVDVWPAPLTIKALACNVTTAATGTATGYVTQAVLYADNGTGAAPVITTAGLLASVTVTSTAVGIKTPPLPSNITLAPGRYWSGMLYYQGSSVPTQPPAFTYASNGTAIWSLSTAFQLNACLRRSGLTAVPTDSVACNPSANTVTSVIVGLQAN